MPADDSTSSTAPADSASSVTASASVSEKAAFTERKERMDKSEALAEAMEPFWLCEIECAKYFDFSSVLSVPVVPDEGTNPPLDDSAWESDEETKGFFHALSNDPRRRHPSRIQRLPPPSAEVRNAGPPLHRHRPTAPFEEFLRKHSRNVVTVQAAGALVTNPPDPSRPRRSPSGGVAPVRALRSTNQQTSMGDTKEQASRQSKGLRAANSCSKPTTSSGKIADPPVRAKRSNVNGRAPSRSIGARGNSSVSPGGSSNSGKAASPTTKEQGIASVAATTNAAIRGQTYHAVRDQQFKADLPVRAVVASSKKSSCTNESSRPATFSAKNSQSNNAAPSKLTQLVTSKSTRTSRDLSPTTTKALNLPTRPKSLRTTVCEKSSSGSADERAIQSKSLQASTYRQSGYLSGTKKRNDGQPARSKSCREREALISVPNRHEKLPERPKSLHLTKGEVSASVLERTSQPDRPKSLRASRLTGIQQPMRSARIDRNTMATAPKTPTARRSTFALRNGGDLLNMDRRTSTLEATTNDKRRASTKASEPLRATKKSQPSGNSEKLRFSFAAPKLGYSRVPQGSGAEKLSLRVSKKVGEVKTMIPLSPRRQVRSTGIVKSNDVTNAANGNSSIPSSSRRLVRSLGVGGSALISRSVEANKNISGDVGERMDPEKTSKAKKLKLTVESRNKSSDCCAESGICRTDPPLAERGQGEKKNAMCVDVETLRKTNPVSHECEKSGDSDPRSVSEVRPSQSQSEDTVSSSAKKGPSVCTRNHIQTSLVSELSQTQPELKDSFYQKTRDAGFTESVIVPEAKSEAFQESEVEMSNGRIVLQKSGLSSCLAAPSRDLKRPLHLRTKSEQTAGSVSSQWDVPQESSTDRNNRDRLETGMEPRAKSAQECAHSGAVQQNKENEVVQEVRSRGDLSLSLILNAGNSRVLQWRSKQRIEQQRALDKEKLSRKYQGQGGKVGRDKGDTAGRSLQPWGDARRNLVSTELSRISGFGRNVGKSATGMPKGGGKTVRGLRLRTNGTTITGNATNAISEIAEDKSRDKTSCLRNVLSERNQAATKKSYVRLKVTR